MEPSENEEVVCIEKPKRPLSDKQREALSKGREAMLAKKLAAKEEALRRKAEEEEAACADDDTPVPRHGEEHAAVVGLWNHDRRVTWQKLARQHQMNALARCDDLVRLWLVHVPHFIDEDSGELVVLPTPASDDTLRTLHRTIAGVRDDLENLRFNPGEEGNDPAFVAQSPVPGAKFSEALAMEHAGLSGASLFVGSFSEWTRTGRAVAKGLGT